jgi:anti-sigma regulatory factor (Ser/Thr protein kinase)
MTTHSEHLRHNALVYESRDEYVARAVPFLREGLEAGEGAIVANTRPGLAAMREALGQDAVHVTFVDVSSAYTRPARTLAAYHDVYAEQLRKTATLRAVADVQVGPDPGEWEMWMGYEAVLNRSFGHLPAWVWCTYNANGLPDPVLEGVWRTHPEVLAGDALHASHRYEDPEHLLRRIAAKPVPLTGLRSIAFGQNIEEFRERLARELTAENLTQVRVLDGLLAATEVANNAIEHGGGVEEIRVGRADGRIVCEIVDRGDGFDDPGAGYLAPQAGVGSGLWVARQLTWLIEFFPSPSGFTTRIWF